MFLGITRAGRVIKISHLIHQVHLTYQKCYRILTKLQRIFNAEKKTTLVMILKIQNPALVSLSLCKINRSQPRRTFFCANAEFSVIGSFLFVAQMTNLTISKCISTIFASWTNQATCQPIKLTLPSCIYAPRSNRPFSDGVFVIAQGQLQ